MWHCSDMSYDLAVWEGERPADDRAAGKVFSALCDRYLDTEVVFPATPAVDAFVADVLSHWPDLTEDNLETSPWVVSGMAGSARGPIFYFPIRRNMADEVMAYAADLAKRMGLVCYDPQERKLRP